MTDQYAKDQKAAKVAYDEHEAARLEIQRKISDDQYELKLNREKYADYWKIRDERKRTNTDLILLKDQLKNLTGNKKVSEIRITIDNPRESAKEKLVESGKKIVKIKEITQKIKAAEKKTKQLDRELKAILTAYENDQKREILHALNLKKNILQLEKAELIRRKSLEEIKHKTARAKTAQLLADQTIEKIDKAADNYDSLKIVVNTYQYVGDTTMSGINNAATAIDKTFKSGLGRSLDAPFKFLGGVLGFVGDAISIAFIPFKLVVNGFLSIFALYATYVDRTAAQRKSKLFEATVNVVAAIATAVLVLAVAANPIGLGVIMLASMVVGLYKDSYVTHQNRMEIAKTKAQLDKYETQRMIIAAEDPNDIRLASLEKLIHQKELQLKELREKRLMGGHSTFFSTLSLVGGILLVAGLGFPPLAVAGGALLFAGGILKAIDKRSNYAISRWVAKTASKVKNFFSKPTALLVIFPPAALAYVLVRMLHDKYKKTVTTKPKATVTAQPKIVVAATATPPSPTTKGAAQIANDRLAVIQTGTEKRIHNSEADALKVFTQSAVVTSPRSQPTARPTDITAPAKRAANQTHYVNDPTHSGPLAGPAVLEEKNQGQSQPTHDTHEKPHQ